MLTTRHGSSLLVETRWDDFSAEWRRAEHSRRFVLDDKRPAVRIGANLILTPHRWVWEHVRANVQSHLAGMPPKKRERRCEACNSVLKLTRELEDLWVFRCPRCGSVEAQAKARIGGRIGAGEKERR